MFISSIAKNTSKMASFLLLVAAMVLVAVEASSSTRFAFHTAIENKANSPKTAFLTVSSFDEQQLKKMLSVRGGAEDDEEDEETDEEDDDEEETDDDDETTDESADEYYDETEEEDEEEEDSLASGLKQKSSTSEPQEFVEPYFISPSLQMYTTFGTILLSRKIDMFNPAVVKMVRALFIVYLLVQQAFIFYVRVMAKKANNRDPVQVQSPLSSMLSSQLEKQGAGGNDMVKNMASSFLKTESTVMEYDMSQATNMQGGILFNVALMWFMHFKLQQVQPLLVTSINGFLQLAYNPLFQVYVMGRNLERPFKNPVVFKPPTEDDAEAETTEEGTEAGDDATEDTKESDEAEKDEESDDEGDDSDDEDASDDDDDDDDSE